MSYNHTKISRVEYNTRSFINRFESNFTSNVSADIQQSRDTVRKIDDLPMVEELANLCESLRLSNPALRFGVSGNKTIWFRGHFVISTEVWAYVPGHEYAMLRLGYGDYTIESGSKHAYCVYARGVRNEKYAEHRDQYHMVMSDKLERAVKNAKKYMRPYAPQEVAHLSIHDFASKTCVEPDRIRSDRRNTKSAVCDHPSFMSEMRTLAATAAFTDSRFAQAVQEMIAADDEFHQRSNRVVHAHHVTVSMAYGEQVFTVLRVLNAGRGTASLKDSTVTTYTQSEVPEDIAQKLAVLSMLADDAYVEGVGHRISATTYWVVD